MSNTKRPTIDRKVTRKTEEKRDEALDTGIRMTIDGEAYEVRAGDVSPLIARQLRAATGMGFMRLMHEVTVDPDIDLVAAFVWVARRIRGEVVDLEDVDVSYRQLLADGFDVDLAGDEDVTGPEA